MTLPPSIPESVAEVVEVRVVRGARAPADGPPDLVIEIPHGATATADYDAYARRLTSPLPANLVDFFHVNTDTGAPELADAVADQLVMARPELTVCVVRCRVPRTFIDCNRHVDASAAEFKAGKVTPGLMPWITTPEDRALLRTAYDRYVATVAAAISLVPPTGALVMMHSYAPRTVGVEVDEHIVTNLRRAYQPDVEPSWPMRPALDVISRTTDGVDHAPAAVVDDLRARLGALGLEVAASSTYPLHPSTLAYAHVMARPGRALCVEVRRDLLAAPFTPFAQMAIGGEQLARLVPSFVAALGRWW